MAVRGSSSPVRRRRSRCGVPRRGSYGDGWWPAWRDGSYEHQLPLGRPLPPGAAGAAGGPRRARSGAGSARSPRITALAAASTAGTLRSARGAGRRARPPSASGAPGTAAARAARCRTRGGASSTRHDAVGVIAAAERAGREVRRRDAPRLLADDAPAAGHLLALPIGGRHRRAAAAVAGPAPRSRLQQGLSCERCPPLGRCAARSGVVRRGGSRLMPRFRPCAAGWARSAGSRRPRRSRRSGGLRCRRACAAACRRGCRRCACGPARGSPRRRAAARAGEHARRVGRQVREQRVLHRRRARSACRRGAPRGRRGRSAARRSA